jgi:hypothetical protein
MYGHELHGRVGKVASIVDAGGARQLDYKRAFFGISGRDALVVWRAREQLQGKPTGDADPPVGVRDVEAPVGGLWTNQLRNC